jgi:hypothetical protein
MFNWGILPSLARKSAEFPARLAVAVTFGRRRAGRFDGLPEAGLRSLGETEFVCGVAGWPIAIGPCEKARRSPFRPSQTQQVGISLTLMSSSAGRYSAAPPEGPNRLGA